MTLQSLKSTLVTAFLAVAGLTPPKTAAEDVADALAGFTQAADKLEAASAKASAEIDASYERSDAAWEHYVAVDNAELNVRVAATEARRKAGSAAQAIRALVGN